jgi:hypothetical protein
MKLSLVSLVPLTHLKFFSSNFMARVNYQAPMHQLAILVVGQATYFQPTPEHILTNIVL